MFFMLTLTRKQQKSRESEFFVYVLSYEIFVYIATM